MLPAAAWTALPRQSDCASPRLADAMRHRQQPPLGVNATAASVFNFAQIILKNTTKLKSSFKKNKKLLTAAACLACCDVD